MRKFEIYLIFITFMMGTLLTACSGYELKLFFDEMLKLHNEKRAIHGVSKLKYDEELSNKAMECDKISILYENDKMFIADDVCYLVYKIMDITSVSAKDVFLYWYNQGQNYDYEQELEEWNAEYFTQIVLKSTERVGFAMLDKDNETWFVAAYSSPGNQIDEYFDNIEKLN